MVDMSNISLDLILMLNLNNFMLHISIIFQVWYGNNHLYVHFVFKEDTQLEKWLKLKKQTTVQCLVFSNKKFHSYVGKH